MIGLAKLRVAAATDACAAWARSARAARRAALPSTVEADGVKRYQPEVEAAIYFWCLEALQNAAKYAGPGAWARVRLWEEAGRLLFEVADDGGGFDSSGQDGAGLTNMRDRLGAVGGTLRVESAVGKGTRVHGAVPVATVDLESESGSRGDQGIGGQ